MFRQSFHKLIAAMLIVGGMAQQLPAEVVDSAEPQLRGASGLFEELSPAQSGINFVQPIDTDHPLKCLYVGGYASPGMAVGDLNGDGLPEVFISGGPVENRLYLNVSNASDGIRFRDVTLTAGVAGKGGWAAGVTFVDIDNDGDLDIYVCNYDSPNLLFINRTEPNSPLTFVESAHAYGLDLVDASFVAAFSDYDRDGDLDVLVSGYQYVNPAGRPARPPVVQKNGQYEVLPEYQKYYGIVDGLDGRPTFTNIGRQDQLLQSNASEVKGGQIRFTNVTQLAGLSDRGVGNSVLWWDYNGDLFPDLYVANDFKVADQLYHNNGDGTFTDVIRQTFPHTTWFSMGSEAADINNDGLPDLFVSDMAGTTHYRSKVTMGEMNVHRDFMKTAEPRQYMRNALFINTGTSRFLEAAYMAGLAKSDWTWAVKMADFDNDGRVDVYITNGAARMFNHSDRNFTDAQRVGKTQWDLWEDSAPRNEENLAFRNLGDYKFEDVSLKWGLRKNSMSYSAAYGDLDADGDLDLVVAHLEEPISVYRNQSSKNNWLRIHLVGDVSNRWCLGASVIAEYDGRKQVSQLNPVMGFLSCNEPRIHFGVGASRRIERLTVTFPSGRTITLKDLAANQTHVIHENDASTMAKRSGQVASENATPLFAPSRRFPALLHQEREFDDYARQPLLPYAHSQLGPGIAIGDADNDGDDDYYLGRARGARRAVYFDDGQRLAVRQVLEDGQHEDLASLFFDADSDGDRDLYCVSGSVETDSGDANLQDRLWVNDGKGNFSLAQSALPRVRDSGSIVCAADYDRDGDLDLFVGSRVVPGAYPVTPTSRLLRNDSEVGKPQFTLVTEQVCSELQRTGLVTSAVWSDSDGDGWLDLFVTHEWGPVKYYRNQPGTQGRVLVDRTREVGLGLLFGWWNGIAARDLDNDGDIDYVVSNFGLNTQYKASDKKPELLYYGSFDGGPPRILEAKFEGEKCFPRRGLSCSSHAMPFVRDKVQTFHKFGISTLQQIYTEQKLNQSLRLSANELRTGVFWNRGEGNELPTFEFQPLPRLAQISPSFGVAAQDFNADGYCDIFLAQNFFSPQLETGRMDSGLSMVLLGESAVDGKHGFRPLGPRESGVLIPGDAKACSLADFNRDGWLDLLVSVNNGRLQAFESQRHPVNRLFRVKLVGPPGNPDCVGARVTVQFEKASMHQTVEVTAGGGYLSQSTTLLAFGCAGESPTEVNVRWPDGRRNTYSVKPSQAGIGITMPASGE